MKGARAFSLSHVCGAAREAGDVGQDHSVILPDSGERYLSSMLFNDWFTQQELRQ